MFMNSIRKTILSLFLLAFPVSCLAAPDTLKVTAVNNLSFGRLNQTIALSANQLKPLGKIAWNKIHIKTAAGRELLCQPVDTDGDYHSDEVIFQADFGPDQTRHFYVYLGKRHIYKPNQFKVYGRFNRKRFGDFAWENDRIADRVYGKALETWKEEPLTSSTVDVWVKRTSKLVINDRYMTNHYHIDTGNGADLYSAGTSRGVGGNGLWANGKLWVSKNHVNSHVLTNGPIRVMFKLMFNPFNVNGDSIKKTGQIALDAGQNLNHFVVSFKTNQPKKLIASIGIEKTHLTAKEVRKGIPPHHSAMSIERSPGAFTEKNINAKYGWITTQQPLSEGKLYCAIIVNPQNFVKVTEDEQNELVLVKVPENQVISYWAGFAWSKSGHFKDYETWKTYIAHFARELQSPIQVTVSDQ
jgi:hypothetical protein